MRRLPRLLAFALIPLLAFVVGCGKQPGSATPYSIGALFALSGEAASQGASQRDTAKMLEAMINRSGGLEGHPLKIVIGDTKSQPAEALSAAKRLVERDHVLALIGPSTTDETLAVKDFASQANVPLISCATGSEIVDPVDAWVFQTPPADRVAVAKIIIYLQKKAFTRVASLTENTLQGRRGQREIQLLMPSAGITLVASEEYGPGDADLKPQLTRIAAARPQAVVCWGSPSGAAAVARWMRQLSVGLPLICNPEIAGSTFVAQAGPAGNGVALPAGRLLVLDQVFPGNPQRTVLDEYSQQYQVHYGRQPDAFGARAWDAVQLLRQALVAVGPDRTRIRDELEATRHFVGADGIFTLSPQDHNGLTPNECLVMVGPLDGVWTLMNEKLQ